MRTAPDAYGTVIRARVDCWQRLLVVNPLVVNPDWSA